LANKFPIQSGLEQGDALLPLPVNFSLKCAIRKVQKIQLGLKLKERHELLVYADDINLLVDEVDTITKKTDIN
jgi:hypothetical protein